MGVGVIGFAEALNALRPDILVVLGDRFEVFCAVSAAHVAGIPVAHLHGGETTEGSFDEAFRHSITKMAHLHFVAADVYRQRVIQLGEHPNRVFLVGGLGVDSLERLPLLSRADLEASLDFKLGDKNLLITFHPVTLEAGTSAAQMSELLSALANRNDTQLIFTLPNADTDGRLLTEMVRNFVANHSNARAYSSLGQLVYLSCIAQVDGVVGNSSSGLLEAPSFKKGSINIGNRQRGRLQASSVINCEPNRESITLSLKKLYSDSFQVTLDNVTSPYGEGGASIKVVNTLKNYSFDNILKKTFYDLSINFGVKGNK
jgi:GDP/UDP-N,N'-diacetylbacillosamine 2-epimerase (hydrolysing)